jgi:hypothetical protein
MKEFFAGKKIMRKPKKPLMSTTNGDSQPVKEDFGRHIFKNPSFTMRKKFF